MTNNSFKKVCLFGGALMAAGLAANVQAQELTIGNSTHNHGVDTGPIVSAYAGSGNFTLDTVIGAPFGPSSIEASFETGTSAQVILNNTELTGSVVKEIDSFGYFAFNTSFIPDSDMDIRISWDASTDVPTFDRHFKVWKGFGATLFEYDEIAGPHAGSITVSLTAGELYWVDALYRSIHLNGGGTFSVSVPQASCVADLTGDGDLNFFDISLFLSYFSEENPQADLTNDGVWDFFDVSAFLGAFTQGCP